jgi:hypothetical protein
MRYCTSCRRITAGQPLFCNFCGRSYDVKLCPSRHVNPRSALVCSQCGSHDLSTPGPAASLATRITLRLLALLPGVLLLIISLFVLLELIRAFLENPAIQAQAVWLCVMLGFLWWLYLQLPKFIRHGIGKITKRKKGGTGHEGH